MQSSDGTITGTTISVTASTSKLGILRQFPAQIKYIVGNEACERFSFYGMRSILVIFMTQYLLMTKENATAIFHLFVSACYLTPLVGAFLADRFLGKYRTIMLVSAFYCLGHGALALWENKMGLFIGLTLIAAGSGGIKPCVSAFVGDQFTSKNKHLVKYVFDLFYWSINFGSFFSTLLIPVLLKDYGPSMAFGIPGVLMLIATVIYWMGRNLYVNVPPAGKQDNTFAAVLWYALTHLNQRKPGEVFISAARGRFPDATVEGAEAVWKVMKIFVTVSVFWALFDQHSSTWVLQANQMDRMAFGFEWEPSQVAALNPIMVMVLIPLFAGVIYPGVEKIFKIQVTPLGRMSAGMVVAGSSFAVVGVYQYLLDHGVVLNVVWHFIPFLAITAAEVMISITGLEFAYTQAPKEMKSTMMSFWFLTVFAGNLITAYVSKINVFEGASFFMFFALLMFVVSGIFIWGARNYKAVDRMQDT